MTMAKRSETEESKPKKRKGPRLIRRLVGVGVLAGGAALAFSEGLRSKVLDKLFGSEEEFQYSPPSPGGASGASDNAASPDAEAPAESAN
jgi:hypothetical protein